MAAAFTTSPMPGGSSTIILRKRMVESTVGSGERLSDPAKVHILVLVEGAAKFSATDI